MFRLTNKYTSILTYNNVSYLGITFFGLFLTNILNTFGILSSEKGIDYYAEAHLSKWNSWIHTLGMPYTFYGISCWVPALCSAMEIPYAALIGRCCSLRAETEHDDILESCI